jgi:hypothetical protein
MFAVPCLFPAEADSAQVVRESDQWWPTVGRVGYVADWHVAA